MAIAYGDAFEQLQRELDQMLQATFGAGAVPAGVYPPIDVFDAGDAYVVKAEVPGADARKIEVEAEEDTLTLRGERTFSDASTEAAYHRREREQGRFRRVVRLPGRVAADEARAEYRNGVLTVRVPKAKESRPQKVTVQAA